MGTLTMKFGGSVVGTVGALKQVLKIVQQEYERWDRLLVVVSALDGVTDALLEAVQLAALDNRRGYRRIAANLRTRHLALIDQLPLGDTESRSLQADIDQLFFDMLAQCQKMADATSDRPMPDVSDAIVSTGERLAARIIAAMLRQHSIRGVAIDATHLLITDPVFGNATPLIELTRQRINENLLPMLDRRIVPVVTGFIGATESGKPTTLGRGGSDLTASILGMCSGSDEVWIWSDVDGMMSTDPNILADAQVISELSYDEVAELAYFGARILHARMIAPLKEHHIPTRVKNVFKPDSPGTLIHETAATLRHSIKAVTSINGLALSTGRSGSLALVTQLVNDALFETVGSRADVMISSQSSSRSLLCFVIPTSAGPDAVRATQQSVEARLVNHPDTHMWIIQQVAIITAIGSSLDEQPEIVAKILAALQAVRVLALAQGPSFCSLSIVVEPVQARQALENIHALVVDRPGSRR